MARPLKYLEGSTIRSMDEFADLIRAGHYVIDRRSGQRVNPGWAASWQFRMAMNAIREGHILRAIPNPEHPDNKETTE